MGTGGMRAGAGRPGWKRKAEQSLAFDVRQVARKGMLRPGAFAWHWTSNYGEKVGGVGVRVVDDAQRMILTDLGCTYAQGFYLHRPMAASAISQLLDARPQLQATS